VAALEASEAAEHVENDTLRGMLARIAADERRHAELAWKFARWALQATDGALGHVFSEELEAARRAVPAGREEEESALGHGVVGEGRRAEIRRRTLREVVAPCASALCEVTARPKASAA
jgi:hypothetical protein